jgi:hypothetical protein
MANFKRWIEDEASLGGMSPEMAPPAVNNGSNTPASDEVKRTNLQPQVDSQEIETKSKKEQDRILAIDSDIEHMSMSLPDGEDADTPKVNKFKQMWDQLKAQWDQVKMMDEIPDDGSEDSGLGSEEGDEDYMKQMQRFPNMVPQTGQNQQQNGPGIFGQS